MQVFNAKEGTVETREQAVYARRTTCRGCASRLLRPILSLGEQYLVRFPKFPDFGLPKAPLDLVRCDECGLLQLGTSVYPDLLFREFWYRTSINDSMRAAMDDLVRHGLEYQRYGTWLDIGANDGYLLSKVPHDFSKIAVEPAVNMKEQLEKVAGRVISDYFDGATLDRKCDVITSAAMFYDVEDPGTFLDGIYACLTKDGVWINQLNDAPTMLKTNSFDALCHEHLCYYDVPTLKRMYEAHGLVLTDVRFNDVNGGSVRTVAKKKGEKADILGLPQASLEECEGFARRIVKWRSVMTDLVRSLSTSGPLWALGASTKGAVLMQYLECADAFEAVADRNPEKIGRHMVGSWLPIKSEADLRRERPRFGVVLPWAFRDEILSREKDLRGHGTTLVLPLPNIEFVI